MRRIILILMTAPLALGSEPDAPSPFLHQHAHGSFEGHAHFGWESRYFTEGRDELDGDSLMITSIELGWRHLGAGIWYGNSPDQSYDELQLALGVTGSVGDFEFNIGYTHLRFPFEDTHDNEIGGGLVWSGLPGEIELSLDAYYSFEAAGYFSELALARAFVVNECFSLGLSSVIGFNQGYVSDGHDGANHFALSLTGEYGINECLSLIAHTSYSWDIDRDITAPGDDSLIDFFHSGVGLQWSF